MKDHFGRNINYLRLSITDRCNLRCKYCMPHGVEFTPHEQILTYEEFLRVARAAVHLGIPRFKITGGEPLVRKGVTDFIAALKRLPGVEEVTLTTNGVRLAELVPALKAAGVDGVNISLDAADPETFQAITGFDQLGNVLAGLDASLGAGLHTKINFVLLAGCEGRVLPVAKLAQSRPVDVRFIEVMPIGAGAESRGLAPAEARKLLLAQWPDLHPVQWPGPLRRQCPAAGPHRLDRGREPRVLRRLQPGAGDQHRPAQALPVLRRGHRSAGPAPRRGR